MPVVPAEAGEEAEVTAVIALGMKAAVLIEYRIIDTVNVHVPLLIEIGRIT